MTVNGLVEGTLAIKGDAHLPSLLDIDIFDAPFPLGKLCVVTVLPSGFRFEQGTAKPLGTIAVGMSKLVRGMHAQSFGATRDAIGITWKDGMSMLVDGNGSNPAVVNGTFIDATSHQKQHQR